LPAVRWYLRFGRSYRDLEELLAGRGIEVDHLTLLYRAVDQFGQIIDVMPSDRRNTKAARRFFQAALLRAARPVEVATDRGDRLPGRPG
jgi:IS6 family transposase